VYGTLVAANVFGKSEDAAFVFKQSEIDGMIAMCAELVKPAIFGTVWPLSKKQATGMLNV
jgi:hypothetical protein